MYDILLRDPMLIDPSQGLNKICSVAINDGKIALVADAINESEARKVLDLRGKIVTPGLIDLHCHPGNNFCQLSADTDGIGIKTGVTLLCDAGTSGSANFMAFRQNALDHATTDLVFFLNIAKNGLVTLTEISSFSDIDLIESRRVIEENRAVIKGIKVRAIEALAHGVGIKAIEMAKKLSKDLKLPLMLHIGEARQRAVDDEMDTFSRQAISLLEEGDVVSHYLTWEPGGLILKNGTVYPELAEARERGVFLDACHGRNHFSFTIARHAIEKGFLPDVISTDLARGNAYDIQSLAVTMSKFLNLGLSIENVIEMTTATPARILREEKNRCIVSGIPANLTVFELLSGDFEFSDGAGRERLRGRVLLEPRMVIKSQTITPAFSGYHLLGEFYS